MLLWTAFAGFVFTYVSLYGVRYLGSSFTDFPSYWLGAQVAFRFHEVPYGETFLQHAASLEQHVHPFVYPPPSLPLFYPFAFMDLETASTAMLAINVVTALGLGFLLARPTVDFAPLPVVLLLIALVASCQSVRQTIGHGQVNLVALATLLLHRWHPSRAWFGLAFGVALLLKLYLVVALIPFLLRGKVRRLAAVLIVCAIFTLVDLPEGSWEGWLEATFPQADGEVAGGFSVAANDNISLTGVLSRWARHVPAALPMVAVVRPIILATLAIVTATVSWKNWRNGIHDVPLMELSAYLCLMVLVAPNSWAHYMVFVVPAAVLCCLQMLTSRPHALSVLDVLCTAILVQNPLSLVSLVPEGQSRLILTFVALYFWARALDLSRQEIMITDRLGAST